MEFDLNKPYCRYFSEICAIPHGSYHEKAVSDYVVAFAKEHGLEYVQDKAAQVPIHVLQACAITKELKGRELTDFETLHAAGDFSMAANVFKQLSDSSRLRIFWLLCHCEECVINLSSLMEMSSPAVSHHLKVLRSAGLIVSRREGKEVYYKAADTAQCRTLHETIERIMEISCPK